MSERIPEGWGKIRLKDIVKVQSGFAFKSSNFTDNGIPIVRMTNLCNGRLKMFNGVKYPNELLEGLNDYFLKPGDILLGMSGSIENYAEVKSSDIPCLLNQRIGRLVVRSNELESKLVKYLVTSRQFRNFVNAEAVGAAQLNISSVLIESFSFLLPPLPEQKKIAAILSSVDGAIEKTKSVIEQTKVVKKGLMQELLTRGIPGRHKKFKKTVIGEIPEEWEVVRLGEIAKIQTGVAKNRKIKPENKITIPYLRVANVQDGFVDLSEIKHIDLDEHKMERYLLHKDDVLFNEGGDNDKLGRGCVWEAQINPCIHQNHVFAVRCSSKISPYYLAIFAAGPKGKEYFLNTAKQTTNLASINSTQLKLFPIPLPSTKEQQQVISIIGSVEKNIAAKQEQLDCIQLIKTALMQVLLTGEVRV